jgi:hypothetical protein
MQTPAVTCAICGAPWTVEELRPHHAGTLLSGAGCERCRGDSLFADPGPVQEPWAASIATRGARLEELPHEDGWSVVVRNEQGQAVDGGHFATREEAMNYGVDRQWPASAQGRKAWLYHREGGESDTPVEILPGLHEGPRV